MPSPSKDLPLSGHLEDLRSAIWRCLVVWIVFTLCAFLAKDYVFGVIFAPARSDFYIFQWLSWLAAKLNMPSLVPGEFTPHFIATELTAQFMTHLTVSLATGGIMATPYFIYKMFEFISPALHKEQRRFSAMMIFTSSLLFLIGIALNYFIVFPFAYRFLSSYQVQPDIINQITISSYISLFIILSLLMGVLFELPIVAYILARLGLLTSDIMVKYRKHAFVGILLLAALITPTGDAITLSLVALPVFALYILSIWVVKAVR